MSVIVEVPGHGEVEFPDGMSDEEMEKAIRKNFMLPPKAQPRVVMDESPSYVDRLKRMGGAAAVGLLRGGPAGLVGNAMVESGKQTGEVLDKAAYEAGGKVTDVASNLGASPEVAAGAGFATNVATQAVPMMLGGQVGKLGSPSMQAGGRKLMQSALKPSVADLKSGRAARAIDTLLAEGVNPTQGGVAKLQTMVDDLGDEIQKVIESSPATIGKGNVGKTLLETYEQFKNQVNPQADLETIKKAWTSFRNHPLLAGKTDIPVQVAQKIKQGTYTQLAKKYGQMGSAEVEAQKSLARGLKEEISKAVPEVSALNKRESDLLNALNVAERRALMDANKNPMGLALLAQNPATWAAFMADKSALFKSLIARMMYSGSEQIPSTAGKIAGGYAGALSGQDDPQTARGALYGR